MNANILDSFEFFTGVPDSQLQPLCNFLMDRYGISDAHIIAANEGTCVGIAAGYHLATGKIPVVYLQNSGIGNIVNPVTSLLNQRVYGIPMIFIVGWRGEPGVHDEPQHVYQGEITLDLLNVLGIRPIVIGPETEEADLRAQLDALSPWLADGGSIALVIRKGAIQFGRKVGYQNPYDMNRERIIEHIVRAAGEDPIVSTTGKISRELFEIREALGQGHGRDFLTVGSMGHASSIAYGIALKKPETKIWCIDGDGAAIMHLGAMAVIGARAPQNMVHIILNNAAHETVGGMPTVASSVDLVQVAKGCRYPSACRVQDWAALDRALEEAKETWSLSLIEVLTALGSRADLGRPTTTSLENKEQFMKTLTDME